MSGLVVGLIVVVVGLAEVVVTETRMRCAYEKAVASGPNGVRHMDEVLPDVG